GALASRSTTPTSADRAQRLDNGRLGAAILVLSGLIDPSRNAFLYSKQVSSQPATSLFLATSGCTALAPRGRRAPGPDERYQRGRTDEKPQPGRAEQQVRESSFRQRAGRLRLETQSAPRRPRACRGGILRFVSGARPRRPKRKRQGPRPIRPDELRAGPDR